MFHAKVLQNDPRAWQKLTPVTPSPVCGYATVHTEAAKAARAILAQVPGSLKRIACLIWGGRCRGEREPVCQQVPQASGETQT